MIGDAEWRELLWEGYQQHVYDSAKACREPIPFERWAVDRTWTDFIRIAQLARALPPVDQHLIKNHGTQFMQWGDWRTYDSIPGGATGFRYQMLARKVIGAFLLVYALMTDLRRVSPKRYRALSDYLDSGKVRPGQERLLAAVKRWVYDWLRRTSEQEESRTRELSRR